MVYSRRDGGRILGGMDGERRGARETTRLLGVHRRIPDEGRLSSLAGKVRKGEKAGVDISLMRTLTIWKSTCTIWTKPGLTSTSRNTEVGGGESASARCMKDVGG